jgi:CrcB protein
LFGVLTGLSLHGHLSPAVIELLGTGACGAYTTFSTFSYETVRLAESGQWLEAALNVGLGLIAGLAGAVAGLGGGHAR